MIRSLAALVLVPVCAFSQITVSPSGGGGSSLPDPVTIAHGGTSNTTALSAIQALAAKGADIASASTTDLSTATGPYVNVTGTTTITALGTVAAGTRQGVKFTGALTLTHNGTSLILPGATNIVTGANDTAIFESLGSGNWVCILYQRAIGLPVVTGDFTTTATAAGTTTLTTSSTSTQFFTGSTTQTVVMPVTSTLFTGRQFFVVNQSTGSVTINSSGSNAIVILPSNTAALLTCILTSGTSAASWFSDYGAINFPSGSSWTISGPTAARTVTAPDSNFTFARTDAGQTFTGVDTFTSPIFITPTLGTPASGTLTNCTFPTLNQTTTGSAASLSVSGQTGLVTVTGITSTNRTKTVRDAADTILELGGSYTPTGTWTSLTLVTPVLGTPTSGALTNCTSVPVNQATGNLPDGNVAAPTITSVSSNTGGWSQFKVSGSDATTTGQSLVDVTGLVTGSLSVSSAYEFEAVLYVTTTAVATGTQYGVNVTVAPTNMTADYVGPTTNTAGLQVGQVSATTGNNIASASFLTTASEDGCVVIKGFLTTASGAGPVFSIRHLKVTSGTSTVKIGSVLRIRKL